MMLMSWLAPGCQVFSAPGTHTEPAAVAKWVGGAWDAACVWPDGTTNCFTDDGSRSATTTGHCPEREDRVAKTPEENETYGPFTPGTPAVSQV